MFILPSRCVCVRVRLRPTRGTLVTAAFVRKIGAQGLCRESSLLLFFLQCVREQTFFFKPPIHLFFAPHCADLF